MHIKVATIKQLVRCASTRNMRYYVSHVQFKISPSVLYLVKTLEICLINSFISYLLVLISNQSNTTTS